MTRPRLEEAARLKDEFPEVNTGNYNDDDVARLNAWGCEVHDLLAALAQPPGGGEVVERAAKVIASVADETLPNNPASNDAANALHAAGLLAGAWPSRERLAQLVCKVRPRHDNCNECYAGADAILREVGR